MQSGLSADIVHLLTYSAYFYLEI